MRRKSHYQLGLYLTDIYMPTVTRKERYAFLLGCVEPDLNPFTYCKGSFRYQWMGGHNFSNSHRYMSSLLERLARKSIWNFYDRYRLGKLIHYTADAFTYAHNPCFSGNLALHRAYEKDLQEVFLNHLPTVSRVSMLMDMDKIHALHREYCSQTPSPEQDTRYILFACHSIMNLLRSQRRI